MIIKKLFKFENAHIVRDCSTVRCSTSIHGHSYKVEVLLESNYLDNGQMVYDFGLMKGNLKDLIDSFDHAITIWDKDDAGYIREMKNYSKRWIELPVSPSAEQFSRVFFLMIDRLLQLTQKVNEEREVQLYSVIVHETETGYAQCFNEDAYSLLMGEISLEAIKFSSTIVSEWRDKLLWEKLLTNKVFVNPTEV